MGELPTARSGSRESTPTRVFPDSRVVVFLETAEAASEGLASRFLGEGVRTRVGRLCIVHE